MAKVVFSVFMTGEFRITEAVSLMSLWDELDYFSLFYNSRAQVDHDCVQRSFPKSRKLITQLELTDVSSPELAL